MQLRTALVGRLVEGRYRVTRVLGEGGFGVVFLAGQEVLGHPVRRICLKVTKATGITADQAGDILADAILLARVLDEIEDGAAKRHLVRVYDMGVLRDWQNRGFIAMEYVPGSTLRAQLDRYHRLPQPTALRYARQICTGLRALHRLDPPAIHRDLKPENILLTEADDVRIVDFGLAARIESTRGYVAGVAGTAGYMAPETSIRQVSNCASDVYSLGVLLYTMLTGRDPFEHLIPPPRLGEEAKRQWIYEHKRHNRPAPPSADNNTIEPWLDRVVARCLQFYESDRYPSATEVLRDLEGGGSGPARSPERETLLAKALAAAADHRWTEAEATLTQALATPPLRSDELTFRLTYQLALCLLEQSKWDTAVERIRAAEALDEQRHFLTTKRERADFWTGLAEVCERRGCPRLAVGYGARAQHEIPTHRARKNPVG